MKATQDNLLDYDDMFAEMTPDILKNIFIRFYTMEDYFQFNVNPIPTIPSNIVNPNPITQNKQPQTQQQPQTQPQPKPQPKPQPLPQQQKKSQIIPVNMLFNRTIQQCISNLYIMNKLINSKAKLVSTILDNGYSIAKKKNESWNQFIQQKCFQKIHTAYKLLPQFKKDIVKFAVLSISNLLLKLAINMSKVSVICIQKFMNFQCLSIPTLSVIFLQNLQYRLFKSKNFITQQQKLNFMRQLPKITYIKLNKYKNNTQIQLLENSQYQFIGSQVNQPVKNMQYIQIHQKTQDRYTPGQYKQKTQYPFMYSIDIQKLSKGKVQAPFYFEILEIMRQIVFPMVKDFRPDLIVYMQSYPNDTIVMNDQVRALMLCQIAQQTTCNKIYVFKQLGIDKLQNQKYLTALKKTGCQEITQQFSEIMSTQQKKFGQSIDKKTFISPQNKQYLNKIKKIFLDQLCYTSLALIQKTSFDNISQKSHRYFHVRQFLQGIYQQQKQLIERYKKQQILVNNLKIRRQGCKMMIQVLKYRQSQSINPHQIINLINKENNFKQFYNLNTNCLENLVAQKGDKMEEYSYTQQDNLIVNYYSNKVIVIRIKKIKQKQIQKINIIILQKTNQQKIFRLIGQLFCDPELHDLQGSTYVCSKDYLYRAFGKFKNKQNFNKIICRLKINPQVGKDWQQVASQGIIVKSDGKQQQHGKLQKKMYGYGFYDGDNQLILLMGGYIDSFNQQRISKNIYWIKNVDSSLGTKPVQVRILGKTNKIVYQPQKNNALFLYPFVFGIPFFVSNLSSASKQKPAKHAFILNSNGYYLNLNHNNKIFTTIFKVFNYMMYNGIHTQNKLQITNNNVDNAATSIFLSEILIKCMVHYQNYINIKGDICCVQTLQQGPIIILANQGEKSISVKASQIFQDQQWRKISFI